MYFLDEGQGEPTVVCVHGYGQSSDFWVPTVRRLAEAGARALAVDLPGFGRSAQEPGPYTLEAFADAIAQLLDGIGLPQIVLAGSSMGGAVAQHFAIRHPQRLQRLLLVATGPYTANPEAALERADTLAREGWSEAAATALVRGFFDQEPSAERMAEYRRIALMASPQAIVEAARSNATARTLERLHEIGVPTLIIQGRHDRSRTVAHGEEMRERIPDARMEVLESSGHTPQLEESAAFHALALPFLLGRPAD